MKAVIKNRTIYIDDRKVEFSSLFSEKTIEKSNKYADKYYYNTCIVNELFEEFILPYFDTEIFIKKYSITEIDISSADEELRPIIVCACNKSNTRVLGCSSYFKLSFLEKVNKIGAFVYLLVGQLKQRYDPIKALSSAVVFTRSKSAKQKLQRMDNIDKLVEISPGYGSVYQQNSIFSRLFLLFKSIGLAKRIEKDIIDYLEQHEMQECIKFSRYYYSKRLIHTAYYYYIQDSILHNGKWKILYTGNNLDRFAINEEMLAKKYGMKLICIPHGIEYGYKFPKCFVGDLFYTTSENAAKELKSLYKNNKFVFSPEIGEVMFKTDGYPSGDVRIVYFSEPREFEVNIVILKRLYRILYGKGINLFLKLHPIDNRENYKELFDLGIKEIIDFKEAICGNICIARKSTALLEAIYNGSKAVAILINEKDRCIFKSFPSLSDERIVRFGAVDEAGEFLVKAFNNTLIGDYK